MFNDEWNCFIELQSPNSANDICAKRRDFVNFIDALHRDGEITDKQVNSWTNPF